MLVELARDGRNRVDAERLVLLHGAHLALVITSGDRQLLAVRACGWWGQMRESHAVLDTHHLYQLVKSAKYAAAAHVHRRR